MLGAGFPPETIRRAIELGADAIAVDGGSTDSGPHYLGTATAKTARSAVARDLDVILTAAAAAEVAVIVGSCGTSGTDGGVDWIYDIVEELAATRRLRLRVARIYSEQQAVDLERRLHAGRVHPLAPAKPLEARDLHRCSHIVGLMGHEPITAALASGADVVLAGRTTDTALSAAIPLMRGLPPGPVWHAAKVAECGGLCTTSPRAGGVLVSFDEQGFEIEPLAQGVACTPVTVAAHLLYENADPFRLHEPGGTLDASGATYVALDDRRVRVERSRWEPASVTTIKLEGSALVGYQTMMVVGIRDPRVLANIDRWCKQVLAYLEGEIKSVLGLADDAYVMEIRRYGHDAVLGSRDPDNRTTPKEVGAVFLATAEDQATATQISKLANPVLLHAPLDLDEPLPSFALLGSPAEIERGPVHEFVLQHIVEVDNPDELFRTRIDEVTS